MSTYGFQVYGSDGSLHFDGSSTCLMLHDSFDVIGTAAYSKSYVLGSNITTAFVVVETMLDNTPDFMFNVFPNPGETITSNSTTQVYTISGTPVYTNVGKSVSSWSTHVSNSTMKFLVYVE